MNQDQRYRIATRDGFTCQKCGQVIGTTGQIAHRIANNKTTMRHIQIFLESNYKIELTKKDIQNKIIDNELNVAYTCSLECNSSFNIFNKPIKRDELLKKIIEEVI